MLMPAGRRNMRQVSMKYFAFKARNLEMFEKSQNALPLCGSCFPLVIPKSGKSKQQVLSERRQHNGNEY
jgi:hypothetical protein